MLLLPAWAAWALLLAAVVTAVAAFLIPPRRPVHVVPSLAVFQPMAGDERTASLWARIRRAVSLMLAAVIAASIAVAIARPTAQQTAGAGDRVLLVLDSSWSMQARVAPGRTRWDAAVDLARAAVGAAAGREIAIATTADGVVEGPTTDVIRLHRTLDRLTPTGGRDAAWPRVADVGDTQFFTDGAVSRVLDPAITIHSVFVPAANVAVTAFDVEPRTTDGTRAEAYLAVANFAPVAQSVLVTVTRAAQIVATKTIDIRAGDTYREVIAVSSAGDPRFRVHVTARDNALEIDDDAVAWMWAAQPLRIGVVGASSPVAALLARDPSLRVQAVEPSSYAATTADVWVFDEWLPPAPPGVPALLLAPPPTSWLGSIAHEEPTPRWKAGGEHAVLNGVDPRFVQIQKAVAIERSALRAVAVSEAGTPLVSVEDTASSRLVVLGFSTANSNLGSTPAFPILVGNAIDWLGRSDRGVTHPMGVMSLPAATTRVTSPTGQSVPLRRFGDHVSATFKSPGIYLVESAGASRVVNVGLDDVRRSNLQVSTVPRAENSANVRAGWSAPWWVMAAWVAAGLVALEWFTWLRRVTV